MVTRTSFCCLALVLFVSIGNLARADERGRSHRLGVQVGWWNVEMEYLWPFGLFADLGTPLGITILTEGDGLGISAKVGYQFDITEKFKIRFGVRPVFFTVEMGRSYGMLDFVDLGLRFENQAGFSFGIEFPLFVFVSEVTGDASGIFTFRDVAGSYFPYSVLLSQLYIGYAWDI